MKKITALLLALMLILSVFASCSGSQKTADDSAAFSRVTDANLYKKAVEALNKTEFKLDGSHEVSEDLIIAINNAEYVKPKNYIYMIGDGMGFNIVEITRAKHEDSLYKNKLAINHLPIQSSQTTYSADNQVTDSAAGGTALATGFKTSNQTVAMNHDDTAAYTTLLEIAAEKGKSTGVVVTSNITDATPAAFTAHVADRYSQEEIAAQQLEKLTNGDLDIALGGGKKYYDADANKDALATAKNASVTYAESWDEATKANLPLVGLFAEENLDTHDENTPSIAQMTDLALDLLDDDENGFFLMVEGSQIDKKAHNNDFESQTKEMYDFDCAVAVAMRFVALNPDTVLVITADHETGGLEIPVDTNSENFSGAYYTTGNHTYKPVPVAAFGMGTEAMLGINENVDVARFIATSLGEKNFGEESQFTTIKSEFSKKDITAISDANPTVNNHTLVEKTESGALAVHFNNSHNSLSIPVDILDTKAKLKNGMRAIHITVKNTDDKTALLPQMKAKIAYVTETLVPQVAYIDGNSTMRVTYILPTWGWTEKSVDSIMELAFVYSEGQEVNLEFDDFVLVTRADNK